MKNFNSYLKTGRLLAAASLLALSSGAHAAIQSIDANGVDLWAKKFQVATPDGDSIQMWGFAPCETCAPQYPAPTLRGTEGETINITLHNGDIPKGLTLMFPGQSEVQEQCYVSETSSPGCYPASLGVNRVMPQGQQTSALAKMTYTFTLKKPGTFSYQSGVDPQITIDMGLMGALIVDPVSTTGYDPATKTSSGVVTIPGKTTTPDFHAIGLAYNDQSTAYDREYLFFLSETDPKLHYLAELDKLDQWDNGKYQSTLYFINGRNSPDTLAPDGLPQMPNQPYGSLVTMHPGQRILLRVINAGRNQHPLHTHGNHFKQIARDGNLFGVRDSFGNVTEVRPVLDYTYGAVQGGTSDLIFEWTGKGLGWDMYGAPHVNPNHPNTCTDTENNITHETVPDGYDDTYFEWCGLAGDPIPSDHGTPLPVVLPENLDLTFGGFWSGSPYLGVSGNLPVGEGGLNPAGGMVFMWHSHSERELTNNDIYPGGMLDMMLVIPYDEGAGDVGQ